jgi:hypothetical protein
VLGNFIADVQLEAAQRHAQQQRQTLSADRLHEPVVCLALRPASDATLYHNEQVARADRRCRARRVSRPFATPVHLTSSGPSEAVASMGSNPAAAPRVPVWPCGVSKGLYLLLLSATTRRSVRGSQKISDRRWIAPRSTRPCVVPGRDELVPGQRWRQLHDLPLGDRPHRHRFERPDELVEYFRRNTPVTPDTDLRREVVRP